MKHKRTSKPDRLVSPEAFARYVMRNEWKPAPKKELFSMRIDADVLEWFRDLGEGYQSRINALLRAYMDAHQRRGRRTRSSGPSWTV